jgi:hypothetical protein
MRTMSCVQALAAVGTLLMLPCATQAQAAPAAAAITNLNHDFGALLMSALTWDAARIALAELRLDAGDHPQIPPRQRLTPHGTKWVDQEYASSNGELRILFEARSPMNDLVGAAGLTAIGTCRVGIARIRIPEGLAAISNAGWEFAFRVPKSPAWEDAGRPDYETLDAGGTGEMYFGQPPPLVQYTFSSNILRQVEIMGLAPLLSPGAQRQAQERFASVSIAGTDGKVLSIEARWPVVTSVPGEFTVSYRIYAPDGSVWPYAMSVRSHEPLQSLSVNGRCTPEQLILAFGRDPGHISSSLTNVVDSLGVYDPVTRTPR